MGLVIRAYRHHPIHGHRPLPQDVVAGWMGLTQGQLSRIERGSPTVHLDRLIHWARLFDIPPSSLWFTLPDSPTASVFTSRPSFGTDNGIDISPWRQLDDTAGLVVSLTRKDFALERREAARAFVGVAVGSVLLEPLERWLSVSPRQRLTGRPARVGCQEVEQIERAAQLFRSWDDQFGGGLRRKAVIGQLNEVAELLGESHPEPIRQRLFGAMAHLAETAATMSWDSGQQALGQRYYMLALRACTPANDPAFAANVLAGMARQVLCLGHPGDALELIRLAQAATADSRTTPTVQAMLYTREAWAYANQGRIAAFQRATDHAETALANAKPSEDPYWIDYFGQAELAGTTGGRLLSLSDRRPVLAAKAADYIDRAIASRTPDHLRSSALDQLGLVEVHLIQRELEEAARLGQRALAIAERTPSDRVRIHLTALYRRTAPDVRVRAIACLRDQMRSLLATPVHAAAAT